MTREGDLERFYELLADLEERVGGTRRLGECTGYMDWPDPGVYGVYFVFARVERRARSDRPRLTRIGTHAVSAGSGTSL